MPIPDLIFVPKPRNITYEAGFLDLQTYSAITICLSSRDEFDIAQSLQMILKNSGKRAQISLVDSQQQLTKIRFLQNDNNEMAQEV